MKKDKTIDTKNKLWIDIRQEANHIVDDFLFLLNPSDVIKNIQKLPEIKKNDSDVAEYLFEIERTDKYGNHFTNKEYWRGYKNNDSQKQNTLHFAHLVAEDSRNYTASIDFSSGNRPIRRGYNGNYIPNWSAQVHTEQLGENKLVITQCQSVYNFSDDETYECASLFKKSGEMIVGGLPYMPIQLNEPYVMQTNMRGLTYTILSDGSYTVKKETYQDFAFKKKPEKAQVDIYDINNKSITIQKNETKKTILLEQTEDSGSKGDKQTFVIPETNLVYTQRNNKFFEISYDLGTAVEISKEKYVQKFEDRAKNYLYHTSANGVTIVSDVIDREYFDGRVYCAIMNKDGKVRNGRWFFTAGKYIYEYNPFYKNIIRLNPDLTEDTTFDQAKFNRIFEYKGKTYFYNDKEPTEMYDENGAWVALK